MEEIGWAFRCSSGKVFMLDKPEALDWGHSTENHEYESDKAEQGESPSEREETVWGLSLPPGASLLSTEGRSFGWWI